MRSVDFYEIWVTIRPWVVAFVPDPEKVPGLLASGFDYALKAGFVIVALKILGRLPQIKETMVAFNEGRGRIWDLRNTVDELKRLEPVIKTMGDRVERLTESVEVISAQNAEAQIESSIARTDDGAEGDAAQAGQPATTNGRQRVTDDANWAKLRRLYLRNARRLQNRVQDTPDGRTRNRYARVGWKRPKVMVETLASDAVITPSVADASIGLIENFNAYKPRHALVPDEVVAAMEVLDRQLEQELGPAPPDDELV